jgi:maleylpyruvate isomerase
MKLYTFFRSGTSHRLRIALNLKGLAYESVAIDLRSEQHLTAQYKAINPQQLVPALEVDGRVLTQSPAIIEWLEERHPEQPLLPRDAEGRAQVRALAAVVGCDIHPVNNRRILEALRHRFGADDDAINDWCATWIAAGFDAFEALADSFRVPGHYAFGEQPTLADVYLVPQVESARRFKVDISRWPRIAAVDRACGELEAFARAAPTAQPDAG